jgi:hypothetical protein
MGGARQLPYDNTAAGCCEPIASDLTPEFAVEPRQFQPAAGEGNIHMGTIDRTGLQQNALSAASCCSGASAMSGSRWAQYLPIWLRGRWGIILGVSALGIGGAALGWPWLVALGIAPILLAIAPCAVMCALGLCMMGRGMNSTAQQNANTDVTAASAAPVLLDERSDAVPAEAGSAPQPAREPERVAAT